MEIWQIWILQTLLHYHLKVSFWIDNLQQFWLEILIISYLFLDIGDFLEPLKKQCGKISDALIDLVLGLPQSDDTEAL